MVAVTTPDQKHPGIPGSHIISLYDFLNDMVQGPDKFHLKNVTQSCVENKEAPRCSGYLFFDLKHPTAAIHHVIADYIYRIL
jgi:phospholipase/lecithinase/hemolysin